MQNRLSAGLALVALASAHSAQAQERCVDLADLNSAVSYAMPLAYDAAMNACGQKYAPDSFMHTQAAIFIDQFRERQDETWEGLLRLVDDFSENPRGLGGLFRELPQEDTRAAFDAEISAEIEKSIRPDICPDIARGMELIEPLPAENVSGIVTFIVELVDPNNPPLCTSSAMKKKPSK